MASIKIKTKGMHCSSCEMLVKDSLEEMEGVDTASADHKSGIVEVNFDENMVRKEKIMEIIKLEGYDIV